MLFFYFFPLLLFPISGAAKTEEGEKAKNRDSNSGFSFSAEEKKNDARSLSRIDSIPSLVSFRRFPRFLSASTPFQIAMAAEALSSALGDNASLVSEEVKIEQEKEEQNQFDGPWQSKQLGD